jgi:hypothetical protein
MPLVLASATVVVYTIHKVELSQERVDMAKESSEGKIHYEKTKDGRTVIVTETDRGKVLRDAKGRFIKGSCGGPGTEPGAERAWLKKLHYRLRQVITEDELEQVIRAVLDEAASGSVTAAKVVLDRVFGKPGQTITHEGAEELILKIRDMTKEPEEDGDD